MRAVVCLLAVLFLAAASSAVAQEKHLIDPMLPGSLNPKPLPSWHDVVTALSRAHSTPRRELAPFLKTEAVEHLGVNAQAFGGKFDARVRALAQKGLGIRARQNAEQ